MWNVQAGHDTHNMYRRMEAKEKKLASIGTMLCCLEYEIVCFVSFNPSTYYMRKVWLPTFTDKDGVQRCWVTSSKSWKKSVSEAGLKPG